MRRRDGDRTKRRRRSGPCLRRATEDRATARTRNDSEKDRETTTGRRRRGSSRALASDFAGRLVVPEANEDGVAKQAVLSPGQIGDLGDQLRADPMHLREDEPAAEAGFARRRNVERHLRDGEWREATVEEGERLLRHAGSDTAGVEQPAIVVVKGEQQGAQEGPRPFRVRPADDDEFAAIEALGFDPGAAVVGEIAAIDALGDDAFEAMSAGGAAERLAVAGFMGAECNSIRRLLRRRLEEAVIGVLAPCQRGR